ncbi:hypothetical protein N7340_07285 [Comamonas aquatica]|uniref:hypothetical protein n=1 Tax=Comamonas aquatica TaxID=225991 RepID=UPI00244C887A|nr:hypothetical protein [Comamonas aquatica]MDH0371577.1 hypothetical protein [Comamonas aquatica]
MQESLSIKIDYQKGRKNPEEIFEAMALYISFYKNLGQIIAESINSKYQVETSLVDVKEGSIEAIISWGKNIPAHIAELINKSASNTAACLLDIDEITSQDQVENIAIGIDNTINSEIKDVISPSKINRKKLGKNLLKVSAANDRINDDETVTYKSSAIIIDFNTKLRVASDVGSIQEINNRPIIIEDILSVIGPINIGDSPWSFESTALERNFRARIYDSSWIEAYQNGFLLPIGPKDSLRVTLEYKIAEVTNNKKKLIDFKVTKVKEIIRGIYEQMEIENSENV